MGLLMSLICDSSIALLTKAMLTFLSIAPGSQLQGMFVVSQPDLLTNKRRTSIMSCNILKQSDSSVKFLWAPFPIEMSGVSMIVPSPSGSKLLVIRNPENEAPCCFEIWSSSRMEKDFYIPNSLERIWVTGLSRELGGGLGRNIWGKERRPKANFKNFFYFK